MIQDLRQENHGLQPELRNLPSGSNESRSATTGGGNGYKEKFEALAEINHGWKKDYEELQMRYEILSGEKRLLEDEERKLKGRINEQGRRNSEIGWCFENLNKEKEKCKRKLEDAKEIIRMLTAELDACKTLEQVRRERGHYSENGYLGERSGIPRHQLQLINPYHQVDERWQME